MNRMLRILTFGMVLMLVTATLAACSKTEELTEEDELATTVSETLAAVSAELTREATPAPTGGATLETTVPPGEQSVVAWLGHVVGLPFGSQFDDYLVLHPEGVGEVGVEGADDEIEAEIIALRDREGVGEYIHVWGTLTCNILDYGGCQLLVNRLRYGQTLFDPDPVEGWEGTITTGTFNMGIGNVFVLSGDFPMWFSIESTIPALRNQLVDLRDTGTVIRVWGELVAGIPDINGTRITVTRIEMEEEPIASATDTPAGGEYEGWKTYTNDRLGYTLKYPGEANIMGSDRDRSVTFEGPLVDNDHWPVLMVAHQDADFFHPPAETDVMQWVLDSVQSYDAVDMETLVADSPTVHIVYEESPMAYGSDHYYFIRGEQLFHIQIVHTGSKQDWGLYDRFLRSFSFFQPGSQPSTLDDGATFLGDVTIPDGTNLEEGESFVKTWRFRNSGESTWTTDYDLVFDKGDQMGGPDALALTQEIEPGQTVEISVELTAPDEAGRYTGYWMLRNAAGVIFGQGPDSELLAYVDINVIEPGSGPVTPTALAAGSTVTGATLNVDNAAYAGACPVTLTFTGVIISQGAGSFIFELEAQANTAGFEFFLPAPQTATFASGGENRLDVTFWLDIENTVSGWARLKISAPNTFQSSPANFDVGCQ